MEQVSNSAYTPVADWIDFQRGGTVSVTEASILRSSAMYRAVSLISGQLASLPLVSYSTSKVPRAVVGSVFDDPDPGGQTPYEWKETAFTHLLLHGRMGALKLRNGFSALTLPLLHPSLWTVTPATAEEYRRGTAPAGGLWFDVSMPDGTHARLDAEGFWYVPALSLDGVEGKGLIEQARESMTTTLSGDKAARKMFTDGALISGIATPDDDTGLDISDDIPKIRRELDRNVHGAENAGRIAIINRKLKITPWSMSAVDAQFIQQRQFQIEEVARWTGVPPHLLMQTEKQTSWGTGVEMQDRALGRTVLGTWATRFEERASRLLANPRHVEFDFSRLERPSPDREIELDLAQVAAGVMTVEEYRAKRGWEPLPKPDPAPAPDPSGSPDGGGQDVPPA